MRTPIFITVFGWITAASSAGAPEGPRTSPPPALRVDGTRIVNSHGQPVRLRGVNAASLEWTSDGEGHILETVRTAVDDWHVDHVRLPLAQDRWFGKAPEQKDGGAAYQALVKQVVELCAGRGCYTILDLHWSDAGEWGKLIGQHVMPDTNSVEFWKSCATAYKNHPAVIFDLYNEPHDVSWDVWRDGGEVHEKAFRGNPAKTYQAIGMQALLETVRATGAKNLVIAGGLNWAYDMAGFLDGKTLSDPGGNGVLYANHAYPFKGDTIEQWIAKLERAARQIPVIVSEFGAESRGAAAAKKAPTGEEWVRQVLAALDAHGWSWTAWDMHPAAGPRLISDWKFTPTPGFGRWVKQSLTGTSRQDSSQVPAPGPAVQNNQPVIRSKLGIFENHGDVGAVLHPGSAAYDPVSQTYTVTGSGQNMWFAEDDFHFLWTKATGDVALTADIAFVGAGKEPHRKACLMIRQSLAPDSVYVDAALHGDGLTSLQFRPADGAATHEVQANVPVPGRLRIEKKGKYVLLSLAPAGAKPAFAGPAVRLELEGSFLIGLGVCAHNKDVSESAIFSNVQISQGAAPAPAAARSVMYSILETQSVASTDRRVVLVTKAHIEAPNWLRDRRSLIYNSDGRIFRVPPEGGRPELVDTGFATRCNNDHGVSPDGALLAISDQSQGRRQSLIYTLPVAGGTPKLVKANGPSYWHGWSPDGKTLAFCGQRDGEFDIYTIPAEGGTETRLTTARGLDDGPEYSPDGKLIYFNSVRTGSMQIWRMRTDGSEQEPVTSDEFNNWFPHISPDGRLMVFLSYEKDVTGHPENKDVTLRMMTLATKKIDVLGRFFGGQGTINVPCWSPDGRRIAFVTYQFAE